MINLIREYQLQIAGICQSLKIQRLEVFGSAATGCFDPSRSDIDFIVEFNQPDAPPGLLSRYLLLAEQLEGLLGKKVDIITPNSIRNPYFRESIESSRQSVYAA